MDINNLKGLMEAYSEVYAPQEEIEEGLRSAVKRLLGGGKKEAEAPKPESRGEQLRKKYNVGPEKSDTSAKRQILNRSRARAERDQERYGDKPFQKQVAQQSKAAHDRYLKAGYSKYGADDARGKGNKAARRAATLNREEFEFIVNALIEEGYDLSSYTYDEMYDICLDEAVKGADPEMRRAASAERRGGDKRLSPSKGRGYADQQKQQIAYMDKVTKKNKNVVGLVAKEELDIFDVVLEFLQAEGYAETLEEAEWMMANLIDEEAIDIILEASCEDDEEEMKKGKKSKKEEEDEDEEEEDLDEGVAGDVAARAQKLANQRKGQTPERKKMYQGLADKAAARERGPFKGGTSRQGMTPSERTRSREAAAYQADVHGGSATYGKGSLPKGKKLERQKARGVSERFEAWLDEALTGERYKKALKKGKMYSRMHSADPAKRATRGGRGGESDFGAGDRGAGNKAARRAGTYED